MIFQNLILDNPIDHLFIFLDGKRRSSKPIYRRENKKELNTYKVLQFLKMLESL